MDDLISRQAAIDAMTECYWSIMGDEPPKLDEKTALYVDLKQAVKRLPTEEPEIIRCKDCLMHGVCRFEQGLGLDGYCSQAERRSDEHTY